MTLLWIQYVCHPLTHCTWPTCLFYTSYPRAVNWPTKCSFFFYFFVQSQFLMAEFTQFANIPGLMDVFEHKLNNYSKSYTSIHPFRSCCNLCELSIKPISFFPFSHPPLLVPVLSCSDPGSAPILQLAASSFQNPGAPPHETKSKFNKRGTRVSAFFTAVILSLYINHILSIDLFSQHRFDKHS